MLLSRAVYILTCLYQARLLNKENLNIFRHRVLIYLILFYKISNLDLSYKPLKTSIARK